MPSPDPVKFVIGSTTFDVPHFYNFRNIDKKNSIQSERFTVGGYDWVAEFYPQGIDESVPDGDTSVSVRVLDATEEVWMRCVFERWYFSGSKWENFLYSNLMTLQPSGDKACCGHDYGSLWLLRHTYEEDETLRIKCTLLVIPRLPAPAPPLNSDSDKPACNGISFGNSFHTASYAPPNTPSNEYTKLPRQPTVRIYCETNKDFSVTIHNCTVVLAPADSNNYYQHWVKDMSYNDKVKDEDSFPAFALVNSVSGEALQNPSGENEEITLVPYNPNRLNDSVMWTEVRSPGFHVIRIADVTSLTVPRWLSRSRSMLQSSGRRSFLTIPMFPIKY